MAVPSPSPPRKRRWRWLAVACLLSILALAVWSSRPEVDLRLAGKWEGWTQTSIPPSFAMFDLRADGTGSNQHKDWADIDQTILETGELHSFCWWVDGDALHLRLSSPSPSPLLRFWYSLTRRLTPGKVASFRVIKVNGRQLVLRSLRQQDQNDASQDLKLQRPKP